MKALKLKKNTVFQGYAIIKWLTDTDLQIKPPLLNLIKVWNLISSELTTRNKFEICKSRGK